MELPENAERLTEENSEKNRAAGKSKEVKCFVFRLRKLCYNVCGMRIKYKLINEESKL